MSGESMTNKTYTLGEIAESQDFEHCQRFVKIEDYEDLREKLAGQINRGNNEERIRQHYVDKTAELTKERDELREKLAGAVKITEHWKESRKSWMQAEDRASRKLAASEKKVAEAGQHIVDLLHVYTGIRREYGLDPNSPVVLSARDYLAACEALDGEEV